MLYKILISLLLLPIYLSANLSPKNVMTSSCLQSYQQAYQSHKTHKAFSYAREAETGTDRCGWGYGNATIEEAKKAAMKQCTEHQLNAECKIVDIDGKFIAKEGDFSYVTPPDNTPLTTTQKEALLKEAKALILGNCLPFFEGYLQDSGYKAFAYSLDSDGKYACGKTYKNNTRIASQKGSIQGCQNNKRKRGAQTPKSPCKIYAQGNKILLKASDFHIALRDTKEDYIEAIFRGNLQKIKNYVVEGMDVNAASKDGMTPLFVAAGKNDEAFFHALISKGASIKHQAKDSSSLLIAATLGQNPNIVRYLLDKGLDINAKGRDGNTALHTALMTLNTYLASVLMQEGADADIKNDKGLSGYDIAKKWKIDLDTYKKLDPFEKDDDGETPLFLAATDNDIEKVKTLLTLGADKSIKNKKGQTVYESVKDDKFVKKEVKALLK